jgi:hypothetical protein
MFYTNVDKFVFELENKYIPKNYFDVFYNYFYFCLLPKKVKIKLLNTFNLETQKIFEDILKIPYEFSNNMEEAKYIVMHIPSIYNDLEEYIKKNYILLKFFDDNNKNVLIFYGGDCTYINDYNFNNITYFLTSGNKSSYESKNTFGCPTPSNDYFNGKFLKKNLSIGFCGINDYNDTRGFFRNNIITQLKNYSYSNFILRTAWGNLEEFYIFNEEKKILSDLKTISPKSKFEFIENIESNLYTLCVRGGGNFSFRLSETFMMGRIPILLDTDCIFPFEYQIPYKKNTIYVTKENSNNFTDINKVILDYHNKHSEQDLLQIQKENRQIWIDYFKIENSFYKTLDIIKKI